MVTVAKVQLLRRQAHHMSGDHKIAAFIFPATIISESFLNYLKNSVDILKQIL